MKTELLEDNEIHYIDNAASQLNPDAINHCIMGSTFIKQLNEYIDGKINLSQDRIEALLDQLIGYFTNTLVLPLDSGLKIRRARKFDKFSSPPSFSKVSDLSYIPINPTMPKSIGRLNKCNESLYYGCIYFNDDHGGINVAFSEVNSQKYEIVNILESQSINEIKVNYIGIFDYVKRMAKPYFLGFGHFKKFKQMYEYMEFKFEPHLFTSFQLCDAFFADIMRREESERLYNVTSVLASMYLEGNSTDGLVYESVKAEGAPVIALKPNSVDCKLEHKSAKVFGIQECYGYAQYEAEILYKGFINGYDIQWRENI